MVKGVGVGGDKKQPFTILPVFLVKIAYGVPCKILTQLLNPRGKAQK